VHFSKHHLPSPKYMFFFFFSFFKDSPGSDHTHGTLTCRSLRAVARVPGRTAESACTMRATRRTAVRTANAPPAARTGGEWETRGSSPSARRRRLKTTGHAGREGVPQRKARTKGKATWTLPRQAVPLGLLKHRQRVATSSAPRAPGNHCHYSAKLVSHLTTPFSRTHHTGMDADGDEEPPRTGRRGNGRRG
jgi:hypothetical protein